MDSPLLEDVLYKATFTFTTRSYNTHRENSKRLGNVRLAIEAPDHQSAERIANRLLMMFEGPDTSLDVSYTLER